ncbi:ABC transporter ATP-binding protein [Desulfospira joergensenii]|uniref:ABC transporter ATP-binding protein n=1 Tax=Desulfospira joergensenii TaxID=53329 RepID=UPI0003B5F4BD|nr:ABC transporter ATP-binding protein [Desulfospira joergensenii]
MILHVNNLCFSYKGQPALERIRFSIGEGETVAILGPNGVGKTTLLKCLNRILFPTKGEILVKGDEIRTMTPSQIARKISYVAQSSATARITAFDAILMGRKPHMGYRVGKEDLTKVDAVIRQLDLSDLSLKTLDCMSGGELQKVCIARALVQETDVILMDEPTASLDLKNQTQILGLIRHIVRGHGMSAIMTMHDLSAAMRYADKYIFLKDRAIYSAGRIQDITPEMVEDVYGVRVDIMEHRGLPLVVPIEEEARKEQAA